MFEYQGFATLGVNLNRQKYGPLDISNVFTSQADLDYYLSKGANTEGVSDYWKNTVPYPYAGQYIALVDNTTRTVTPYMLSEKADGTFETIEVGGKLPEVDGETIKIEDGKLTAVIPEYTDTNTTYKLTVTSTEEDEEIQGVKITLTPYDGEIAGTPQSYVIADPDLSDYITASELATELAKKANASEVYTKTETDTKIGEAVAAADHLKRKIVDAPGTGETIDDVIDVNADDADQYIYMVPTGLQESDNKYREYIVIIDGDNRYIEQVGNWEVDLSGYLTVASAEETYAKKNDVETTYAKKEDIPTDYISDSEFATEIAKYETAETTAGKYVAKEEGKTLIATTELERLAKVNENAEENYIDSVDETKFTVTDGKLELKELTDYAKVSDVYTKSEIDTKIGTPGIPEEKGEDGNIIQEAAPGTGVYQNVYSKAEVTDLIADITGGESAADVKAELTAYKTSNDAAVNGLASRVGEVETKVTSLETLLNGKAEAETVEDLVSALGDIDTRVSSLETELNSYVTKSEFTTAINDINDRLTWKTLSE